MRYSLNDKNYTPVKEHINTTLSRRFIKILKYFLLTLLIPKNICAGKTTDYDSKRY